jgi:D-arabinose 1-dehydrogenase-like Zn-dependent alcohol dehydrogenase
MSLEASRLFVNKETRELASTAFKLPELSENEVRIQVTYSGISRNDILYIEGKLANDYFGVAAVGNIVAIGKNVGTRKVGEVVGVYYENINRGEYKTGYSTYLQIDVSHVIYLPITISLEQASGLLGDGVVAFNALERLPKGSVIAVIGSGNLAYLTVRFAKLVFGFHVTVLSLGTVEGIAESFGADAADVYSIANVKKYEEKFDAVVITEPVPAN